MNEDELRDALAQARATQDQMVAGLLDTDSGLVDVMEGLGVPLVEAYTALRDVGLTPMDAIVALHGGTLRALLLYATESGE